MKSGVFGLIIFRNVHASSRLHSKFLKIGNVRTPVRTPKHPELVPKGYADTQLLNKDVRQLKWLLQKDALKQDVFLIGVPGTLRSSLVLQWLELSNREFEYLPLTRDTTEADVKQRREIRSGNAFYTDLCAVRAALNGRVLVIDGVEKAERNVLPILNNLLENREIQLDDGRFLMASAKFDKLLDKYDREQLKKMKLERVSEDFVVVALGLPVPPFKGHSLDPPLRSRFQCLNISGLPFETAREISESLSPNVDQTKVERVISLAYALNAGQGKDALGLPRVPIDNVLRAVEIWNNNPRMSEAEVFELCFPAATILRESERSVFDQFLSDFAIDKQSSAQLGARQAGVSQRQHVATQSDSTAGRHNRHTFVSTPHHEAFLSALAATHSSADFCILGPSGAGKTVVVEEFARRAGYEHVETVSLYADLNSRELLQSRRMLPNGDTTWSDSQLITAAKQGHLLVLDGLERVHWSTAEVLASLIHHRFLHLPDGGRLVSSKAFGMLREEMKCTAEELNSKGVFEISPRFRLVALADSESATASGPHAHWLNEQILSLLVFHTLPKLNATQELELITRLVPNLDQQLASKLLAFVHKLRDSHDSSIRSVRISLSLRRLIFILRRHAANPTEGVYEAVQRAALFRFLPAVARKAFEKALEEAGIQPTASSKETDGSSLEAQLQAISRTETSAADEMRIPDILFFENEQHNRLLLSMAKDFALGAHLLLIGNQGVGKNKVVDRFLQLIKRPRAYMQLHRDTTVQSLTVQSTVEEGILKHEDSPLVKAVREGLVLVIDEGDKAPLQVVAILKSLLDSGFLHLSDGRRIQPLEAQPLPNGKSIAIHSDFRMVMLANRPGFPFLGNDLFGTLGDLFSSVHVVDNPDRRSEIEMLRQYAPNVKTEVIEQLVSAFGDLRELSDAGRLIYPYSTRELVNIVKHLERFPDDAIPVAVRNVFDFDSFSKDAVETIEQTFRKHGIPLGLSEEGFPVVLAKRFPLEKPQPIAEWGIEENVTPHRAKVVQEATRLKDRTLLDFKRQGIQVQHMRAYGFTEQETVWQLDLNDNDICSDVLSLQGKIVVASVNPPAIHVVNASNQKEAIRIELVDFLPKLRSSTRSRLTLAPFGPDCMLIHEETTNTLLKFDFGHNSMERVEFAEQGVFEKLLPQGLSDPTKHWRIVSADENVVAAFQRTTNEFLLLDARSGQTTRIDLPAELRIDHVLPVEGNGRFLIVAEKKHFLLTVEGTDRTFLREVQTSADVPADLQSVRPLDSKFALASPDQAAFDSPAFLMAVPAFYALKSTNFPRTFEKGSLSGWPRNADERMIQPQPSFYATAENRALVHPAKRSVVFPNGLLVRALPLHETPEKAMPNGEMARADCCGFLEVVNTANGFVQYLPVPSPRSQNYYNTWWATIADVRFVLARGADGRSLFTCDNSGGIRRWELDSEVLLEAFGNWRRQVGLDVGNERLEITKGDDDFDLSKLDVPKFGKIDPQNTPHAGGNTWAGGTGGYNTAGLGGVGGPFRLDAGHDVQQISEAAKNQVPEEIKRKARAIAKREYEKRLKEIELSEHDATAYNSLLSKVLSAINLTKRVLEDLQAKEKDRRWAKHQTSGDLDDGKLIEGMTGERNVYRKRVEMAPEPGTPQTKPKHLRLLIDASGSMYRFNGHDKRLQKALETTLLVMEALDRKGDKIKFDVVAHSGETPELVLTNANSPPSNEKQRLDVLKKLLAHAQFCLSGDYTMEAIEIASRKLSEETDVDERILIAISDANLDRYGIRPQHIARVLAANENVNCFLILIGSLGKQAEELRRSLPAGKAFIAKSTAELPHIMQEIFASTLMR